MNLISAWPLTMNMDLVAFIRDLAEAPDGDGGLAVTFAIGGSLEVRGCEALALRRFIGERSLRLDTSPDPGGDGTIPFSSEDDPSADADSDAGSG